MLDCILEMGADVNAMERDYGRPLHLAEHPEQLVLLAHHGARLDLRDHNRRTPQQKMLHELALDFALERATKYYQLISILYAIGDVQQSEYGTGKRLETKLIRDLYKSDMISEAILESGYKPKYLKEIAEEYPRLVENVNKCREIYCNTPLSLQRQAANVIRTSLKPNAVAGLRKLQLPPGFNPSYITLGLIIFH